MIQIDFQKIRPLTTGKRESFEELCCQLFYRHFHAKLPKESKFYRLRGAGGDGGVEAIWFLKDGTKIGVQSKYFYALGGSQISQLDDSLETAIKNHPELKLYIICLPFDPTGPKAAGTKRQSKGEIKKLEEWRGKNLEKFKERGINLEIDFWTESNLKTFLITLDSGGGLRRYWFDTEILTPEWFQGRLAEARAQAGKRYSPELSIEVPAYEALEAFACTEFWKEKMGVIQKNISDEIERWKLLLGRNEDLSEDIYNYMRNISDKLNNLTDLISCIDDEKYDLDLASTTILTSEISRLLSELEQALFNDLRTRDKDFKDSPGYRQFHAEYMAAFPAGKLDATRDLIKSILNFSKELTGPNFRFPRCSTMLLYGPAGVGKTHAIVDHAVHRNKTGQLGLVFFGEDFHANEPWVIIANKLGLSGSVSRDELWGMLDSAAESTGKYALIYIDALNESTEPQKWKNSWLPTLSEQLSKFSWLKLCISCRDTYLDEVINATSEWPSHEHNGFVGREFEAIRRFFEHYELQPPATPLLQQEFSNPLFLHLICQGLKGAGLSSIPYGSMGFNDVIRLVLKEKNKKIASICSYDSREDKVTDAIHALAKKMALDTSMVLNLEIAKKIINSVFFVDDYKRSLFYQLEKEGIISVFKQTTRSLGKVEWFCRFTFERVADFLIAFSLLEGIKIENIKREFEEGNLAHLCNSDEIAKRNRGILEALSIILPEKFKLELPDLIEIDRYNLALPIFSSGLEWRDPETFSSRTIALVEQGLTNAKSCPAVMETLLRISIIPNCELNAFYLDDLLNKDYLTSRDPFWCGFLHDNYEKKGSCWRLLEWSMKADLEYLNEDTAYLFGSILGWFCAASDRRVRDKATKGLTRLFLAKPETMLELIPSFKDIDDDYVLERVCLASYSAMLLTKNDEILAKLSKNIYYDFFSNGQISLNALIRDWLRLIVELAVSNGLVQNEIDTARLRPPYDSPWPIEFPAQEEIADLLTDEAFKSNMNLSDFGIGTDFARYILDPILNRFDLECAGITREQVHRWFVKNVSELGYPGPDKQCYKFDRYLTSKYGSGRGKPGWAERLGKKYYWILLQRLTGILADHLPLRANPWDNIDTTPSLPRLQGVKLRDIDPTDLRISERDQKEEWWTPIDYNFDSVAHLSSSDWIWAEDFPDIMEGLQIEDHDGNAWVNLSLYYPLKKVERKSRDAEYPYRDFATLISSAIVNRSELSKIKKALIGEDHIPENQSFMRNNYTLLLGEYPNTLSCKQAIELGDLYPECDFPGSDSAQATIIEFVREFHDSSLDGRYPSLDVPSPDIINFGRLKWNGKSSWQNEDNVVQGFAVRGEIGSGFLIRKAYLDEFLNAEKKAIIFIGYQEKLVVTQTAENFGIHDVRSVFTYDGKRVKCLRKIKERHRPK